MKVNFKRVATAALAVAMSLSLSVPAFAEGNGGDRTLTVTGDTLDNKNVYAVQMFTARATGTDSVVFDNYELADENWLDFFHAASAAGGLDMTGADADAAREYVEKLTGDNLVTFADKAQAWVRGHADDFEVITSDSEEPAVADQATFTKLKAGYYLVYPEGGSTGTDSRGTDAMLVNVPRDEGEATLNIKSTFPTVEKTVEDNNENTTGDGANGSAQVGDIVTFTLTSKVPDMSDYNKFYFAFNDTLSNGLKFVADSVEVTIGSVADEDLQSYYQVTAPSEGNNELVVKFENLKGVSGIQTGDAITVTYQAVITEAATTINPATNKVEVEYSNDPNDTTHGTSTPDISKVYTYDIDVNKWASDAGGKEGNLAGAEFILSTNQTAPSDTQITGGYSDYEGLIQLVGSGNSYRVAKPDDMDKVNSFTTTATGDINIAGLEAGTYYLHEVNAPDGYNKLKAPVKIVITITSMDTGAATITVDDQTASGDGTTVDVENKKGIELPETGSIGTIGLTALGVVVVVAGLFAFPRKKKNRQD